MGIAESVIARQEEAAEPAKERTDTGKPFLTPGRVLILEILAMVFTICLYAPFEMVLMNRSEFWFKLSLFWWMPVLFSVPVFVVFALVGYALRGRIRVLYGALFFAAALCFYIQGNFLNLRLGLLNGATPDWSGYHGAMMRDLVIWAVITAIVLLVMILLRERASAIFGFVSFLLIGIQTVSLISLLIPVFADHDVTAHVSNVQTDTQLYEVGSEGNLIVFIVDMFDDDYFRQIYDEKKSVLDTYDGFTWFDNFTGAYSTTAVSLDLFLTGQMVYNEKPREEWRSDVWAQRLWLDEVAEAGYEMSFYTPNTVSVPDRMKAIAGNYQEMDLYIKDDFSFFKHLYRLAACKYFPNIVKPYIWMDCTEFDSLGEYYNPDNTVFRDGLGYNNGLTLAEGKKEFKFIHINGAHYPYSIQEDGTQAPGGSDAITAATGTLAIIGGYLDEMKKNGTYEDASIIITADHGYYWDGVLSNPVCLIKQPGAHGGISVDHAPACQRDLFPTLVRLSGSDRAADYGTDLFDIPENADVERYFYQYYLLEGDVDGNFRMIEYSIPPESSDVSGFALTDVEITYHGERIPHAQYCESCQNGGEWLTDHEKPRFVHECTPDNPSASEVKHLETF